MIPKRKIASNRSGVRCVAENAAIGAANASPVRAAAGIASTMSGDSGGPERTITSREHRGDQQSTAPRSTRCCPGRCRAADRRRVHRVEDPVPVEAGHDRERRLERRRLHGRRRKQPRGQEGQVRHAAEGVDSPTRRRTPPRPRPIAARNSTGVRNELNRLARKVRWYCSNRCSKTRPIAERGPAPTPSARPQSTSERPVRRRNTSSSEDRRTSTVSGSSPRACAAATAASPSSA